MRMTEAEYQALQAKRQGTTPPAKPLKLVSGQPSEDDEQAALAKLLNILANRHKFKWCHVPNGGDRDIRVAARLKAHGVKRGVPDVMIFDSPPLHPCSPGVAIELKRRHGGVVSQEQKEWLEYLENKMWCCCVAKGWKEARDFLKTLGWT